MAQVFIAIIAIGLFIFAVKVAIALLLLAGLIFRTKETIGLIVILAAFALLTKYPLIGFALIGILVVAAIVKAAANVKAEPDIDDPPQE